MPPKKKKKNPSKTIPPKNKKDKKQGKLSKAELEMQKLVAALDDISSAVFGGTVHERKTKKRVEIGYNIGAIASNQYDSRQEQGLSSEEEMDFNREPLKPGMSVFRQPGLKLWGTIVTVEKDTVTLDNNTKPLKKNRGKKWIAIRDEKYDVPMLWFVKLNLSQPYDYYYQTTVFVAVNRSIVDVLDKVSNNSMSTDNETMLSEYKCIGTAFPQDYGKGIIALTKVGCDY